MPVKVASSYACCKPLALQPATVLLRLVRVHHYVQLRHKRMPCSRDQLPKLEPQRTLFRGRLCARRPGSRERPAWGARSQLFRQSRRRVRSWDQTHPERGAHDPTEQPRLPRCLSYFQRHSERASAGIAIRTDEPVSIIRNG